MGCRVIEGWKVNECGRRCAVLYCSVSGVAFGPVMESGEEAEDFMKYLERFPKTNEKRGYDSDPRVYTDKELGDHFAAFRKERSAVEVTS